MSFSASTCLTNSGTIPLGGLFNIYSNVDQFFNEFQSNVTYSQLFNNCPYIMGNVPDGTTIIKIIDTLSKCCVTIDILSNDLCETCELGFEDYETNTVGVIVAGELTGSCQNTISDYRIFWYGPDNPNQLAFTSGYGSEFSPYENTHPLSNLMQPAGNYIPIIDKVKLDGLNFSQTGGTNYIQAELDCFNAITVNVAPFRCDNGTEEGDYTHRVNFAGAAAGVIPLAINSTFELSATTDYFAWKFKGNNVPDTLKITFYGSSYSEPIILEFITIGVDTVTNLNLLTLPKSASTRSFINSGIPDSTYLSKVTSLTSLSRNPGDYLILEVIPNPNNQQTNWDFYFTCLDTFDCSLCLDDYLNSPYKIDTSSIINIPASCGLNTISFNLSGCTTSAITNSDIYKYMATETSANINNNFEQVFCNNTTSLITREAYTTTNYVQCNLQPIGGQISCSLQNTNTISFIKNIPGPSVEGVINMTFSNLSDLIAYKSSYESKKSSSGWINDSTNILYYQYAILSIPNTPNNQPCGDNIEELTYNIHFSSIVETGETSNNYTLKITMPTIQNNLNFTNCDVGCEFVTNSIVTNINNSSIATSNNRVLTNNTGSRYIDPFAKYSYINLVSQNNPKYRVYGFYNFCDTYNSTIPFSGNSSPYIQIPSLSSQTCDYSSKGRTLSSGQSKRQEVTLYDFEVTQGVTSNTFTINSNIIVNGAITTSNYPVTAVTVVNGVVTSFNPSYAF